jgi:hypothetical protein
MKWSRRDSYPCVHRQSLPPDVERLEPVFRSGPQQAVVRSDHPYFLAQLLLEAQRGSEVNRIESAERMAPHHVTYEAQKRVGQIDTRQSLSKMRDVRR